MKTPENEQVEVHGPWGFSVSASGGDLRVILYMAILCFILGFALYLHHIRTESSQVEMAEKLTEVIYLLSLTQDERAALKIVMPESLRKKVRREREDK